MAQRSMRAGARARRAGGLCAATLVLAGCGAAGGAADGPEAGEPLMCEGEELADAELLEAALDEGSVTLYTAGLESQELAMAETFTEDTGIEVEVVRLPGARLMERTLSEHGSGQLPADVINQSDWTFNAQLLEEGVVEPYRVPDDIWNAIPEQWKEPEGAWYELNPVVVGIAYNTELVSEDEAPTSWEDLLDPRWSDGQVVMGYAGVGGVGWSTILFQRQQLGETYWEDLAAQSPVILESTPNIVSELVRGEYPVGVVGISVIAEMARDGEPVMPVYPEEGAPVVALAASRVADSPSPNAGDVYMNWRVGLCGQQALVDATLMHGVHDEAPIPEFTTASGEQLPPVSELWRPEDTDWVDLRESWVAEWDATYGY